MAQFQAREATSSQKNLCIKAATVNGTGQAEVLLRITITTAGLLANLPVPLPVPIPGLRAVGVVVLDKQVTFTQCDVFTDKALVNGTLTKDLLVKFGTGTPLPAGVVQPADCTAEPEILVPVRVTCPFAASVTVPGALPGQSCEIEFSVDAEQDLLVDTTGDGIPDLVEEKVSIHLTVTALGEARIAVPPVPCPVPTPTC